MNEAQIIDLFVKAAEVERKLPRAAGPAKLKAMNLGYVHAAEDIVHYAEEYRIQWFRDWLDPDKQRNTKNDMGVWSVSMEVIKLCPNESQRRALWGWARSEAGGTSFSKWCKAEGGGWDEGRSHPKGISRQLGLWRKDRAIECISRAFSRKLLQHNETATEDGFTNHPEIGDKRDTIRVFRLDDAKPTMVCDFDQKLMQFDWAEKQNARRRERDAERRKRQAA